jgi:hypothetical protein
MLVFEFLGVGYDHLPQYTATLLEAEGLNAARASCVVASKLPKNENLSVEGISNAERSMNVRTNE